MFQDALRDQGLTLSKPGTHAADCSRELFSRYSFAFAQQIHYLANPKQPGPIYFKTPRKCGVFGVMAEALPQMALFLLDEAVETGKGDNTVISFIDFFFLLTWVSKKVNAICTPIIVLVRTKITLCYNIFCGTL